MPARVESGYVRFTVPPEITSTGLTVMWVGPFGAALVRQDTAGAWDKVWSEICLVDVLAHPIEVPHGMIPPPLNTSNVFDVQLQEE